MARRTTPRSATPSRTAASACTSPKPSGCSSKSASARLSSFSRQLDPEIRQDDDGAGEHDEPGDDRPLVTALTDAGREGAAEQDQHADDEPAADDEGGRKGDQALPVGCGGDHASNRSYPEKQPMADTNYSSGDDYIVEFLGYRFTFNAFDFEQRVVAAAVKLGLLEANELDDDETADLVELAAVGATEQGRSALGTSLVRHWERISLVDGESLVYWLRKLIFRGAWLDHRVKEGVLEGGWGRVN